MLFKEAINSWTSQISTFLDDKILDSQFRKNWMVSDLSKKEILKNEGDLFIGYVVLFWSLFFFIYDKWLNKLLRRKCFPLSQRNRIISTIWDCVFCVVTINYLLYNYSLSSKSSMLSKTIKFNLLLLKGFYIHQAGLNLFNSGSWIKGSSYLFFALFAFNRHSERLDPIIFLLLFLKVIDKCILSACRFLLCFWTKQIHMALVKILFVCHCLTWSYLYVYFVPKFILWGSSIKIPSENFHMWLWFICECLNSVWLNLFESFDTYFFPPPSKEAVDFLNRIKKQKALLQKQPDVQTKRKAELLKTVTCVMSVKKKLQRIRKAKEAKLGIQSENKKEEMDEEITKKREVMESLLCAMTVRKEIQKIRREKRNSLDSEAVISNDNKETDFESIDVKEKTDEENLEEIKTVQETSV